jgi:3-oxoacyl-[acyl-carrier protein] reductase
MDLQLKGKTALVTGASMGIGRAIAKSLALEGVKLCITARRGELLEELSKEIVATGGEVPYIVLQDMMDEDAAKRLCEAALAGLGRIDILVNSAGGSQGLKIDSPEEAWMSQLTMNFIRVRQLALLVVQDMIKHQWGRIINISGKSEPSNLSGAPPAKAGLHLFSKALSREVGKHRITVNSIAPGKIMSEQILRKYSPELRANQSAEEIPIGRYGEPEELAVLATFLASPLACYITGTVIPVDGGLRKYAY